MKSNCQLIYKNLKHQTLLTVIKGKLILQRINSFCESPYNLNYVFKTLQILYRFNIFIICDNVSIEIERER